MTEGVGAPPAVRGTLRTLWQFRRYGRPQLRALAGGVAVRVGELAADLLVPWPLAIVVDGALGNKPLTGILATVASPFAGSKMTLVTAAAVGWVVLIALSGALDYLGDRVMNGAGERITANVRGDVFAHLQRLPLSYHDTQSVGELTSRVAVDTSHIEDALVDVFSTLLPGVVTIVGLLAVLLALSPALGFVALVTAPAVLWVASRYTRLSRQAARSRRTREGFLTGFVAETLTGIRTVHALGRHDVHDERFHAVNDETLRAGLHAVELRARFTPLIELTAALGSAALLWVGAWGVLNGGWSLGLLLVAISYTRDMLKPLRSLSKLSMTLSRAAASAERIGAVLALDVAVPMPPDHQRRRRISSASPGRPGQAPIPVAPVRLPARARGELELRGVEFEYGRGRVLDGADLHIGASDRVALTGPNGAGKSTLLSVMAGLYTPQAGEVLLDGRPLATLPPRWLRRQMAFVLQDTFLFSGSLWDNLRYGRTDATDDEVREASRAALVEEFATMLPDGYATVLGDGGIGLSGGQRQRVAIARALLANAPVVLLDEPTSGLDVAAERTVIAALTVLMRGRTVVMTTHRPALLDLADVVYRLDRGLLRTSEPVRSRSPSLAPAPPVPSPSASPPASIVAGSGAIVISR